MSQPNLGGWTAWHATLTEEAKAVFKQAMEGFVGVGYTPQAFATQVVAGTNYCFLCQGTPAYLNPPDLVAKVYIYQPLPTQGAPHLVQIVQIQPAP